MSNEVKSRIRSAKRRRVLVSVKSKVETGRVSGYVIAVGPTLFCMSILGEDLRFNGFQYSGLETCRVWFHPIGAPPSSSHRCVFVACGGRPRLVSVSTISDLSLHLPPAHFRS